ncbi:hypothetical protein L6452_08857 [Arctium lappa]|uniref:Uncharacterized protein n=1 Tax=Arctium lappa TaxID=4217 RepID=A0ACB9DID7_ARCLA|nr:hypothetical protein L6452_08857 [Arctium lappa]
MKMNAEDGLHQGGGCWMEKTDGEDHRRRRLGRWIYGFEAIEPAPLVLLRGIVPVWRMGHGGVEMAMDVWPDGDGGSM